MKPQRVLIFGATGMIGHGLFKVLSKYDKLDVYGTKRRESENPRIRANVDADNFNTIIRACAAIQPDVIINCIGIIKQDPNVEDHLSAITVNSQFPHRLSMMAKAAGARIVQISTDCVFSGKKGFYSEGDNADAEDIYGKTKALGEILYPPHCVTLRTALIGHELRKYFGLTEWFLSAKGDVNGFVNAYFSGLTVIELGKIIAEIVIPNEKMTGLYHVSADSISKYDLLCLFKKQYETTQEIKKFEGFSINRTLDSTKFREEWGYVPPSWEAMISELYRDYMQDSLYRKYI